MINLKTVLENRSSRLLRATAGAHQMKFNNRCPKQEQVEAVYDGMLKEGNLARAFRQLEQTDLEALKALKALGGTANLHEFKRAFGEIRPYRPWREDNPPHPWRHPISSAEKLWYLGFIEIARGLPGRPDQVIAPAEVLDLLPPLPRLNPIAMVPLPPSPTPQHLLTDIAVWLGMLMREDIRPMHERWVPVRFLYAVNSHLTVPDDLTDVRSELQSGRLRFLHYLAEVTGLVAVQHGYLKPTVRGWEWLDADPTTQWHWLWEAWNADLRQREERRLWTRYRLPSIDRRVWKMLRRHLRHLQAEETYDLRDFLARLAVYLPGIDLTGVEEVLRIPLTWAGITVIDERGLALTALGRGCLRQKGQFPTPGEAELVFLDERLWVGLPLVPRVRPLAEVLSWAELDGGGLWVDQAAVRRAVGQGYSAQQMVRVLAELCGHALPLALLEQLQRWERWARGLRLQQMVVLTCADSQLLAEIRADRHLRSMVGAPLSPHHLAVHPQHAERLCNRLAQRGLPVTRQIPAPTPSQPLVDAGPHSAEYLWLATRVYRKLGEIITLPMRIPSPVLDYLGAHLPEGRSEELDQVAATVRDDWQFALEGYAPWYGGVTGDDPAQIRAAVETAFEEQGALTIEYFSPARGALSRRTIEPLLPITERNGAEYIEAWCQNEDAARTFRLDRIVQVLPAG